MGRAPSIRIVEPLLRGGRGRDRSRRLVGRGLAARAVALAAAAAIIGGAALWSTGLIHAAIGALFVYALSRITRF